MSELIEFAKDQCEIFPEDSTMGLFLRDVIKTSEIKVIPLDKVKKAIAQIIDEKDFAYADFDRYKEEVLCVEPDELPDDDFRYGMERCLDILDKLIAEREEK